jgi:hypothetical protein
MVTLNVNGSEPTKQGISPPSPTTHWVVAHKPVVQGNFA